MIKIKILLTSISAFIIPGSGHVILGRPVRGLLMIMWIFTLGYITFHLTTEKTPLIGRLSGGLIIWCLSVFEVYYLANRHWQIRES